MPRDSSQDIHILSEIRQPNLDENTDSQGMGLLSGEFNKDIFSRYAGEFFRAILSEAGQSPVSDYMITRMLALGTDPQQLCIVNQKRAGLIITAHCRNDFADLPPLFISAQPIPGAISQDPLLWPPGLFMPPFSVYFDAVANTATAACSLKLRTCGGLWAVAPPGVTLPVMVSVLEEFYRDTEPRGEQK